MVDTSTFTAWTFNGFRARAPACLTDIRNTPRTAAIFAGVDVINQTVSATFRAVEFFLPASATLMAVLVYFAATVANRAIPRGHPTLRS
jgi:hypothetical protein